MTEPLTGVPGGVVRVLLIEDHLDLADVLRTAIEREGFDVTWGATCRDAMMLIQQGTHDVLVSDISLPDGTGWEIVRVWKSLTGRPAIAISAMFSSLTVFMPDSGFDLHLPKPFDLTMLTTAIYELIGADGRSRACGFT